MAPSILIAYATIHGSTQEVAELMAETLRGCGLAVEVQPANKVKSVAGYRAVILGAPLYMFHWHADAKRFLSKRQSELGICQ